ncbi:hypothetical protein SSP24_05310 [Streptomyces spinoverrucosus]|uniref:Uncharacterized protein n=1 Tax=Streptomyces spinoverrucosus TaxID=284043 RepID=A0A4Y3VD23_9ACTN|nr:hypothetical protein [Streptomyces spinoverrucosus]GEC02876.1 hypothetical protein SSP24_05310 [Streptomyces spinoverrucosus]GHB39879.1 hypothetical protein GCM10010397_07280 [Streptomyces spinoverrucosus]
MAALPAVTVVLGYLNEADAPWWVMVTVVPVMAGLGAWAGTSIGRRRGIRDAALEPGEMVLGTYTVQPPYTEHVPPDLHQGPQYQIRVTTQGIQLWERSVLLWRYPWPELRVLVDGPRLRLHHEGREAGTMLLTQAGAVHEIRALARRHGAG